MKSFKEFLQWNFWFGIVIVLMLEAGIYAVPVVAHFLVEKPNPFDAFFTVGEVGWLVCAFVTLVWWTCLGQKFQGQKDL